MCILMFFVIFVMVVLVWDICVISIKNEQFVEKAECSDTKCNNTTLLMIHDDLQKSPIKYITVDNFNTMVQDIQNIIITKLAELVKNCSNMNGADGFHKDHLTFTCLIDMIDVEKQVIDLIVVYITKKIKHNQSVNINPLLVRSIFMIHLDLLESVINPLLYSKLYTIHGINYFTHQMLVNKVHHNLKVANILYTSLIEGGIDVFPNNDDHGEDLQ